MQSIGYSSRPLLGPPQPALATAAVQHDATPDYSVTVYDQPPFDSAQPQPAAAFTSPVPTTAYTAPMDTAQHSPPAALSATPLLSATLPLSATPILGTAALTDQPTLGDEFGSHVFGYHPVAAKTNIMLEEPSILSQPLAPVAQPALASPDNPFVPLSQQPLDDPLYDPSTRAHAAPVISAHQQTQLTRTAAPLKPLDDPLYDPAAGTRAVPLPRVPSRPVPQAPVGPVHGSVPEPVRYSSIDIAHWPIPLLHLINDPVYGPAVEAAILEAGRSNQGVQVGTPRVSAQPAAAPAPAQRGRRTEPSYFTPRRVPGTVSLQNIGRTAAAAPLEEAPYQPKQENELGGADVLPQDSHYVKPTTYSDLGAAARSALSGAGWKADWAYEAELARRDAQGMFGYANHVIVALPAFAIMLCNVSGRIGMHTVWHASFCI